MNLSQTAETMEIRSDGVVELMEFNDVVACNEKPFGEVVSLGLTYTDPVVISNPVVRAQAWTGVANFINKVRAGVTDRRVSTEVVIMSQFVGKWIVESYKKEENSATRGAMVAAYTSLPGALVEGLDFMEELESDFLVRSFIWEQINQLKAEQVIN